MTSFDVSACRERAHLRHERRVANGKDAAQSHKKYARELVAVSGLEQIVEWALTRGISVSFSSKEDDGTYDLGARTITLSSRSSPERVLHYALHECGHAIIGQRLPGERYGFGYSHATAKKMYKVSNKIDILDEELGAWEHGRELAKKLGVKIDILSYNATRNEKIMTYMKWIMRVHPYENGAADD